ncbi:carboxypeptidase regulatory-like domain-containing protein [Chloroflexota bacterium]
MIRMCVKWGSVLAIVGFLTLSLFMPTAVCAHGANIEYTSNIEVEIEANYDNGEPMAGGQVVVYAPDDAATPWVTGVCDDEGRFSFTPDTSKPGVWDVQVRLAGHGDIVHIPIGESTSATDSSGGYSTLQIALMSACVIWGSVGTALYFSRRRNA